RVEKPPREQQLLDARGTDEIDEAAARRTGEAVTQCARDGDRERRLRRRDAEIARERDRAAAAGGDALNLRDGRLRDVLEAIQHLIDPRLVIDRVLRRAEALELRDVRAGDERFAARAAQNQDADIRIVV